VRSPASIADHQHRAEVIERADLRLPESDEFAATACTCWWDTRDGIGRAGVNPECLVHGERAK
jgi:hypothetical protein